MKTVRSFANEETEANVYWQKLQQVYKLNKRKAMAYTYYVWSSGVGGWPWGFPAWGWDGQGGLSRSQSPHGSPLLPGSSGVSPALLSAAGDPLALNHWLFLSIKKCIPFHSEAALCRSLELPVFPCTWGNN